MTIKERHDSLKRHLKEENPLLLEVVEKYKILDKVGYKTGFLAKEDSYTAKISWWPIISMLGTFSAGKSTFINNYMGLNIQNSGNQAVDDKFTAICYGESEDVKTLPGMALNADARFPFYGISDEVDKIEQGEGDRLNLYLQLKAVNSQKAKGRILIDSPGFDADSQRDTILRMTKHVIDISDLVLIFFDARHPEPGAMRDTLDHLVKDSMNHADADKVIYILNQIDTTSKEDNLEDVISAWQRALAQNGLITGNFYTIYNEESADVITDPAIKERLQNKKNVDMEHITNRMAGVRTERAYRIANMLDSVAKSYRDIKFPKLREALSSWSKRVALLDVVLIGLVLAVVQNYNLLEMGKPEVSYSIFGFVILYLHFYSRKLMAKLTAKKYEKEDPDMARAIISNTNCLTPMFAHKLKGWNSRNLRILSDLSQDSRRAIQRLNDQYITAKEELEK